MPAETARLKRNVDSEGCGERLAVARRASAFCEHRINRLSSEGWDTSPPRIRFAGLYDFVKSPRFRPAASSASADSQPGLANRNVILTISPGWLSANSSVASCRDTTAATRLRPSPLPPTVLLLSER
jgi:hypothetical protein